MLFSGYAGPALNAPGGLDIFDVVAKNAAMLSEHPKDATSQDHYSIATTPCGAN